jgi:hypothetical protein
MRLIQPTLVAVALAALAGSFAIHKTPVYFVLFCRLG